MRRRSAAWLDEYERKYGPRGTSETTTEKVPLSQTCGPARVIDVRHLVGTTKQCKLAGLARDHAGRAEEARGAHGELKAGDVVIFRTGHSDKHFKPRPEGNACLADAAGRQERRLARPGPDAIRYLAEKKVRCVATDGPTLGGVEPRRALMTYWAMGSAEMVGVEFLTNVGQIPKGAYFLFAAVKIRDCHGGPGRAIVLY